eukprot:scaffold35_cov58-Cylindrotheca_fusiformis.AAC.2
MADTLVFSNIINILRGPINFRAKEQFKGPLSDDVYQIIVGVLCIPFPDNITRSHRFTAANTTALELAKIQYTYDATARPR